MSKFIISLQNKNGYTRLTFIFLIESKKRKKEKNKKEAQSLKVNSTKSKVTLADAESVNKELKAATSIQKRGKYELNIPSCIRAEVGKYALCYGTQHARKRSSSKYLQYGFKRSTVNKWKKKITKDPESIQGQFTKVRRPNI